MEVSRANIALSGLRPAPRWDTTTATLNNLPAGVALAVATPLGDLPVRQRTNPVRVFTLAGRSNMVGKVPASR